VLAEYAHEVRGHLHTALGYLALSGPDPSPRAQELIAEARRACQQAVDLADAVLDEAAEERRGLASIPLSRPVDLLDVVRGSVARAELAGTLRAVSLHASLGPGPCLVLARQHALERLLDNLVLNAVEHTREGGAVVVRAAGQGDRAVVAVEDEGPGIPERDLERIFTPFYRSGAARRDRVGGLGLSLARRWATQCRGRLWAENRAGGGARFVLQLPLQGASPALASAAGITALAEDD
jgi:two-component system OmpR family sensor kinase